MVERLRALAEHPLDRRLARAVVVLACSLTVGFAALVALGATGAGHVPLPPRSASGRPSGDLPVRAESERHETAGSEVATPPRQDPQDRPGSAARRRAGRELGVHRALQHVPYRHSGVAIDLIGARGDRAVLRVRAKSIAAARRGWRAFLRRFGDAGRAYLPAFDVMEAVNG